MTVGRFVQVSEFLSALFENRAILLVQYKLSHLSDDVEGTAHDISYLYEIIFCYFQFPQENYH